MQCKCCGPILFYIGVPRTGQFLAHGSIICYSARAICYRPSVCPSVRPSVTRVDQSKTVEVRITQSSPQTLVYWCLTSPWNSKGKIGSWGIGVGKLCNFQPSRRISETVQDRTKVTINGTRIFAFDWYQNHRPWMTLNCCKFNFSRNFALGSMFGRQQRLNEWR